MKVIEKKLFKKKLKYVMIKNKIKQKTRASVLPPNPKLNAAFTSPNMD